jgi:hypothetical protein
MKDPTETELSYLAGIVDGEGCISIATSNRSYHVLRLGVGNTSLIPLEMLQSAFGGPIYDRKPVSKLDGSGLRKQQYYWLLQNAAAARALSRLIPHLRIKLTQAQIALEFEASRTANFTPADQRRFTRRDSSVWDRHEDFRRRLVEANGASIYKRVEQREPRKLIESTSAEKRREQIRQWRANNPDRVREIEARSRAKRRVEMLAAAKEWREKNPDQVRAYNQEYYEKHRDELNAKARERRAAKKTAEASDQTPQEEPTVH